MQQSFNSIEMEMRIKRDSALMKAHALIDWERLRPLLSGLYKREASRAGGQEPFDALRHKHLTEGVLSCQQANGFGTKNPNIAASLRYTTGLDPSTKI